MNSIKCHHLYPLYIEYLKSLNISNGAIEIFKISNESFFEFKYRYNTDDMFKDKQDFMFKSIVRENKIDFFLEDDKLCRTDNRQQTE